MPAPDPQETIKKAMEVCQMIQPLINQAHLDLARLPELILRGAASEELEAVLISYAYWCELIKTAMRYAEEFVTGEPLTVLKTFFGETIWDHYHKAVPINAKGLTKHANSHEEK